MVKGNLRRGFSTVAFHKQNKKAIVTSGESPAHINSESLHDVSAMVRKDVIPYYVDLILNAPQDEIIRVNNLILSKWTASGLLFIKDRAWKIVNNL